jgi:hypothetical protein
MAIEEVSRIGQWMRMVALTAVQEFSIEIPDKEADAIHSGKHDLGPLPGHILKISQSSKQWSTSSASPMVSNVVPRKAFKTNNFQLTKRSWSAGVEMKTSGVELVRRFCRHCDIFPCV